MRRFTLPLLLAIFALLTVVAPADAASSSSIALGTVAAPAEASGVDRTALKMAAETELRDVDASHVKKPRNVVVSVAVSEGVASPAAFTVSAVVIDAKSGSMIAVLSGRARAEGHTAAEARGRVLRAAVHNAVSQIPTALSAE